MTSFEFNEKYKDYLEEGHYGLAIDIPSVTKFLDGIFSLVLIHLPGFKYSQIKLKLNNNCFFLSHFMLIIKLEKKFPKSFIFLMYIFFIL